MAKDNGDKTAAQRSASEYIVFEASADGSALTEVGRSPALNNKQAIGKVLGSLGREGGTFVAIPSRNVKPLTVQAQTRTTLKIG